MKHVFSEYGVPKTVMSDKRPLFTSKKFKAITNQICFDHITSSARYPQSNGMIEQIIQTVKQCLKKCMAAGHNPYFRVSHWNKSSEFTLLTFTTFVPRPKKVKKFFLKFSDTILIPPSPLKFAAI